MNLRRSLWLVLFLMCVPSVPADDVASAPAAATQLEIDVSLVAFSPKEIEAAARKQAKAAPTSGQILDLWAAGKGRLVCTQKAITEDDRTTQFKAIEEFIFPTEFESTVPQFGGDDPAILAPAVPGSFETQATGSVLDLTPQMRADGSVIGLTLSQQWTEFIAWDEVTTTVTAKRRGKDELILRQPRTHTTKFSSSLAMKSGHPLVLGAGTSRDGRDFMYLIVSVTPVDATGRPMSEPVAVRTGRDDSKSPGGAP